LLGSSAPFPAPVRPVFRVGTYARVSTKDKGQGTENQLIQLRDHCARIGYIITYIDHSTAKHGDRDQFKAMFDAAARHEFDAVLVWALDRFTREGIVSTFLYVKRLSDHGVKFISHTEPQFSTTGNGLGELMIALAARIAEQERRRICDRTRAGLPTGPGNGNEMRKANRPAESGIPSRSGVHPGVRMASPGGRSPSGWARAARRLTGSRA
jgi:DNA invertase Pin-like site-specific DNA recombinase